MISTGKVVQLSLLNLQSCVSRTMFGLWRKRKNVLRVPWVRGLGFWCSFMNATNTFSTPASNGSCMISLRYCMLTVIYYICKKFCFHFGKEPPVQPFLWISRKYLRIQSNTENYFRIVTRGLTFLFSGPIIRDNDGEKKEEGDNDDDDGWL